MKVEFKNFIMEIEIPDNATKSDAEAIVKAYRHLIERPPFDPFSLQCDPFRWENDYYDAAFNEVFHYLERKDG